MTIAARLLCILAALVAAPVLPADPEFDAAPAHIWPMARGCPSGSGRSALVLRLPLAEAWHREFDKTAFGAVPVIADGMLYVGDLDGTFHALALDDGATRWTFRTEQGGFPSAAALSSDPAHRLVIVGDDTGIVRAFDPSPARVKAISESPSASASLQNTTAPASCSDALATFRASAACCEA